MSYFRFFVLLVALGSFVLITGATAWQDSPASRASAASAPLADAPDANAAEVLDQALANWGPSRVQWLETRLWMRVHTQSLLYEAEGRHLAGPDRKLCLELKTHVGGMEGSSRSVCDGATLWQSTQVTEGGQTTVTRVDLDKALDAANRSPSMGMARAEFLRLRSFMGITPLLTDMRTQLHWVKKENVRRGKRDYVKVSGVMPAEALRPFTEGNGPALNGVPRECRVYFDRRSLWPYRIEWWGSDAPREGMVPLVQMEFQKPVINQPPTPEQMARDFSFDPHELPVADQTQQVAEQLQQRARELRR
jgi:hypothetical protein